MNSPASMHFTPRIAAASFAALVMSLWASMTQFATRGWPTLCRGIQSRRRAIRKGLMAISPRGIRCYLTRRLTALPLSVLDRVVIRPATSMADFHLAERLVHDSYVDRGWLKPQPDSRYRSHRDDGSAHTLVMEVDGEFAGTVTIVADSGGLPMERTFPRSLDDIRSRQGNSVVEVCSLAVAPRYRRSGIPVVMVVAMWRYASQVMGATHMANVVSSHIGELYSALFNFRTITGVRNYEGVPQGDRPAEDDPVVGVIQEIGTTLDFVRRVYPRRRGMVTPRDLGEAPFPAQHEWFPSFTSAVGDATTQVEERNESSTRRAA